ncbi:MAG: saccharopine dehydrogenase NADP-binding domain-containing protein [Actinomycetota bacterium]|nr:saccharopine dehydrogenase NADP-binding domain-containing protein [Actinomycetota bacterium]
MRVLIVGAGGVGEAFAKIAAESSSFSALVVTDVNKERAEHVANLTKPFSTGAEIYFDQLDASNIDAVVEVGRKYKVDAVMNCCDPRFVMAIFDAAFELGATYIDMAMSLSVPHQDEPYSKVGKMLGDDQFAKESLWKERGLLALVGMGVEPGMSDVLAAYAAKHLFSEIDEVGVRDGANLSVEGYDFAPTFSIWTTIEECLNPPLVYERDRGWFTTPPFSEGEIFEFPEGIGPVECVNVEHEEVALIPRWINAKRVTFKYGLGDEFIDVLKTLHKLGLDSTKPVSVRGLEVSPRDVVAATLPNPIDLGPIMKGKTCAGTFVTGLDTSGSPKKVYLYHVVDNEETMKRWGCQAVVWQTAIFPVVALEMISEGIWTGSGVLGPEAFDPDPFLDKLNEHGSPWGMRDDTTKD